MTTWPGFVPDVLTPMSPGDALDAIADAYEAEMGGEIPAQLLLLLAAQSALETAQWRACHCWNFGNVRGTDGGAWTSFTAGEVIDGKDVTLPPSPDNKFAASKDRLNGARLFVRYLCVATHPPAPNRYQPAIDAATRGDAAGFVHGLRAVGYFTAAEGQYIKAELSEEAWLKKFPAMQVWLTPHVAAKVGEPFPLGAA